MRRSLVLVLLVLGVATPTGVLLAAAPPARSRFANLSNREAWDRLPRLDPALPVWARALTESLPLTTARMLELDHLHRAQNPLGNTLAAEVRREVADVLGCEYAKRYAEADLRRAANRSKSLTAIAARPAKAEQAARAFARKLTRAGHEVTDAEVAELLELLGPEGLVALVHTVAHANFQDRIFLALGVAVEPGGPLPPLGVRFGTGKQAAPARPAWREVRAVAAREPVGQLDWEKREYAELERSLEKQKARRSRIPMPGKAQLARIPAEARAQASRVVWTRISMGYQPRLTKAWFDCMRTFSQEAKFDPVFSGSLFWVITRTNDCFY